MSTNSLLPVSSGDVLEATVTDSTSRRSSKMLTQRKSKIELDVPDESQPLKTVRIGAGAGMTVRGFTLRTLYLGSAFCLLFTAFNVAQAYLTILYPDIGTYTLGIIYGFFALGSLIAPQVGDVLGAKWAMCVASVSYVVFIGVLNTGMSALVLLAAAVVGLGSGSLWINQGVWLSRLSANAGGTLTGYFTGLFFTTCNLNGVTGNLLAIVLLQAGLGVNVMIWGMFVVGAIGSFMMIFVDPMRSTVVPAAPQRALTLKEQLHAVWDVTKQRKSLVILPCIWIQGCNLAFMFGRLPDMLPEGAGRVVVAEVFLCYGLIQCIFSYVNGIIYDRFGWKPLTYSLLGSGLFGYFILITLVPSAYSMKQHFGDVIEPYLLVGGLLGHLDTTLNTAINLAMSQGYKDTGPAFGFFRVGFCAAMSIMSIFAAGFGVGYIVVWNWAWVAAAGAIYIRHAKELHGIPRGDPAEATAQDYAEKGFKEGKEPLVGMQEGSWNPAENV